jgi:hypothetical protein
MKPRWEVPFVNAAGERCVAIVELAEDEARICSLSPHTAENIARTFALQRALSKLPADFSVFDLVIDQIRGPVSVH